MIPKLVYEENKYNALSSYIGKMKPAEFPNVRKLVTERVEDDIIFDYSKINIVFVGTFYEDIRNPHTLLEIIAQLSDTRIVFHFIGGGCEEIIEPLRKKCGSRLKLHGYHSLQAALNAMDNADFLINVDNTAKNMLPSKLNDYISACKPIINLHPFLNSASVTYLKGYPLCLNLCMEVLSVEEMAGKIYDFCVMQKMKDLHFDEVAVLYSESTPSYIANLLMSDLPKTNK